MPRPACLIAQQRRWRDAPAHARGWDVGTLSSNVSVQDRLATFRYRVAVPNLVFFPRVKVALAWDSAVTSSGDNATASTLTVDLDRARARQPWRASRVGGLVGQQL